MVSGRVREWGLITLVVSLVLTVRSIVGFRVGIAAAPHTFVGASITSAPWRAWLSDCCATELARHVCGVRPAARGTS
jgi:hypothetical protein